jgi:hypothetical protein
MVRIQGAITLQSSQIIGVTQAGTQMLEDGPVPTGIPRTDLLFEKAAKVGDDLVVVEQRIVDVEQEDEPVAGCAS